MRKRSLQKFPEIIMKRQNPLYEALGETPALERKHSLDNFTYFEPSNEERSKLINSLKNVGAKLVDL